MKFILFGLFFSLLFNSCNQSESVSIDANLYSSVIGTMIANAEYENQRSRIKYLKINEELDNPLKAKISKFQQGFDQLETNREEFTLLIKPLLDKIKEKNEGRIVSKDDVFRVQEFLKKKGVELYEVSVEIINENFQYLNIDQERKEKLLEELFRIKLLVIENDTVVKEQINSYSNRQFVLLILQSSFYEYQREIETIFANLIYARTYCSFEKYFPVVIENTGGCLNKGDLLEMKIGIGTYSSLIDSKNTKIIVDGDTLFVNDSGVAIYEKPVNTTGEQELDIKCIMFNPLTGAINSGGTSFIYKVN